MITNTRPTKADWERCIPKIKRAVDATGEAAQYHANSKPKVWHDNEKFLLNSAAYRRNGLQMVRFPPNSGDLNPIETVWAKLRADLAVREQADLGVRRVLTKHQFRARVAHLLQTYSIPQPGQQWSYLQKLVRGMPSRLKRCRSNNFGRSGK